MRSDLSHKGRGETERVASNLVYNPSTIFATMSRWISDEPPKMV